MSNLSQFSGGGGGGLTPKFQEFTSSGTFTPSQALIDAGGYIDVFLVGGGGSSDFGYYGGSGGEVIMKKMYLSSTSGISVVIGSGGSTSVGGSSTFSGASAGGQNLTALGGAVTNIQGSGPGLTFGATWGAAYADGSGIRNANSAGSGVLGYGAGGATVYLHGGIAFPKANSGGGARHNQQAGSGYCLITWYE
jgi:hypothetical protein